MSGTTVTKKPMPLSLPSHPPLPTNGFRRWSVVDPCFLLSCSHLLPPPPRFFLLPTQLKGGTHQPNNLFRSGNSNIINFEREGRKERRGTPKIYKKQQQQHYRWDRQISRGRIYICSWFSSLSLSLSLSLSKCAGRSVGGGAGAGVCGDGFDISGRFVAVVEINLFFPFPPLPHMLFVQDPRRRKKKNEWSLALSV